MKSIIYLIGLLALCTAATGCTAETTQASDSDTATNTELPAQEVEALLPTVAATTETEHNTEPANAPETASTAAPTVENTPRVITEKPQQAAPSGSDKPLFESPNYKTGGKIVPGRYACQEMPGMQLKSLSELGSFQRSTTRWTSQFDIVDGSNYTYRGSTLKPGKYTYNAKSGTIMFTSGPYGSEPGEEDTITGIYTTRSSDDHPVVLLLFQSPSYGESCEYCALVPQNK